MKEIFGRKLPPSSYQIIHLPTLATNATPKRSSHQEQGVKRQRVKKSLSDKAEEFCFNLDPNYPSFSKVLVKSHVGQPFWMMLPRPFCKRYLPPEDAEIILEYQNGKLYYTKYLAARTTLSGGWRKFSMAENLLEGDELVFHLVGPNKFKVYRLSSEADKENGAHAEQNLAPKSNRTDRRTNDSGNIDVNTEVYRSIREAAKENGAHAEQNISPILNRIDPHTNDVATRDVRAVEPKIRTHPPSPSGPISQDEDHHGMLLSEGNDDITQQMNLSEEISPRFNSGNSNSSQFPQDNTDCIDYTNFGSFLIEINELLKSICELPWEIKRSYYQLCSSQHAVLHGDLLKRTSSVIVAGSIFETVNIANSLKSCDFSTSGDKFAIWDKKLKSLEGLGMNVGFLSAHLHRIQRMAHEVAKYKQQYNDLCSKQTDSESTIKSIEDKLSEMMRASEKHADDIEKLKSEIVKHELKFQEQLSAPW